MSNSPSHVGLAQRVLGHRAQQRLVAVERDGELGLARAEVQALAGRQRDGARDAAERDGALDELGDLTRRERARTRGGLGRRGRGGCSRRGRIGGQHRADEGARRPVPLPADRRLVQRPSARPRGESAGRGTTVRMRTLKTLTVAAAIAALAGGTAAAQQQPSDTGTNANGPITILKNMQAEPDGVVVRIDGHEVDHLHMASYDDITSVVKPGTNTLTVMWNGPVQRLNFKVAYAPTRNNFKNVLVVQSNATNDASLRQAGAKTMTFTIPG